MDFHGLKRKELQQLCKKHGIPANLKNVEMADRLSALFKEEKQAKRGRSCLKDLSVINEEEVVESKDAKRVRFSPQNETFEFEKTDPREMRMLARKKRGFRKSEIEENPGFSIWEIVQSVDAVEKEKEKEKPVEKNLRRRTIVVNSDRVSDSRVVDNVAKPVGNLRRKSVVIKSDKLPDSGIVDHGEKPVERVLRRRRTFVNESDANVAPPIVDDVEKEKPVGKNLRRKSVVIKSDSVSDSKIDDDAVEKEPVGRNLRRKSVVGKSQDVVGLEVVDKVEKPVGRVSRRRSVVSKQSAGLDSVKGVNVDNVENYCAERGDLEQNLRCRGKKMKQVSEQDGLLPPCVEKKAKTSRKDQEVVGQVDVAGVDSPPDKMVTRRQLRSRQVDEVLSKGDDNIRALEKDKLAEKQEKNVKPRGRVAASKKLRNDLVLEPIVEESDQEKSSEMVPKNRKRKTVRKKPTASMKQEVKGGKKVGVKDIKEAIDGDNKVSETKGLRKTKTIVDANSGPKVMVAVSKPTRQEGASMVEALSSDQVVGDNNVDPSLSHLSLGDHEMTAHCVNEQGAIGCSSETPATVHHKDTISALSGGSTLLQNLSDGRDYIVDEQCPATEYSMSVEEKEENSEEATEIFPKSAEKMNNTMPLEDCNEESYSMNKARENAISVQSPMYDSSIFQNSGDAEAENATEADNIQESYSNLNDVTEIFFDATALTHPSILKKQLCDALFGSNSAQNSIGDSLCHSIMKTSMPERSAVSDVCRLQPSSSFHELVDEMRNNEAFESNEIPECNDQSRNEQLIQPESWFGESPCLSCSPQIDIVTEDKLIDYAALAVEESDINNTSRIDNVAEDELVDYAVVTVEESDINNDSRIDNVAEDKLIDYAAVTVEESDINNDSKIDNVAEDELIDYAAVTVEESDINNDCRIDNVAEDELVDYATVTVEESDINNDSRIDNVAEDKLIDYATVTVEESSINNDSRIDNVAEDKLIDYAAVTVEESDIKNDSRIEHLTQPKSWCEESPCLSSSPQHNNVVEDKSIDCTASIEEDLDVQSTEQGKDSSNSEAEDFDLVQSPDIDDTEARTEPSSTIKTSSFYLQSLFDDSVEKGEESCKEIPESKRSDSCILVNNFVEECCRTVSQLDEVYVKLEVVKEDMNSFNEIEELQFEKADSFTNQDALCSPIGGDTPILFQESNKASESISVSDKANYMEQSFSDATELSDGKTSFKNNNVTIVEDRKLLEASHSASESEHNLLIDFNTAGDKLGYLLNDKNNICADMDSTPQKNIHHQLENLRDNYIDETTELTVLSGLKTEESHKEARSTDLKCNVEIAETADENDKYITVMQQEEVKCFNESEFQHLVSGNDKDNTDVQNKDMESESIDWTSEYLLALDGEDKGEKSVLFQCRKSADLAIEGSTLQYGVHSSTASDITMHLEGMDVEDGDTNINRVDDLCIQDIKPTETSISENSRSSCTSKSISEKISEYILDKETVVSELDLHPKDDDTTFDKQNNNTCCITAEAMENPTPKVSHAEERTNLSFEIDNFTAQEYSVEKRVDTMAEEIGFVEEAGVVMWGRESPESTIHHGLDEAPRQAISQQKEAIGEGATSAKKDISNSYSENKFGKVGIELFEQSSLVVAVSEKSKRDVGNEIMDSISCGKLVEMTEISGCPMRNSENISQRDATAGMEIDAGSLAVSASLHTSEENICNETLQNACVDDGGGVCPGKGILFKNDQDDEVRPGDMVELNAENVVVLPSETEMPDNIVPHALVGETNDGPENDPEENVVEFDGTKEKELQGLTCSPYSVVNKELNDAKDNYEVDIAELRDNIYSAMLESHSFDENKKGDSDTEEASECAPDVQTDDYLNDANTAVQENANEEQKKDVGMNGNNDSTLFDGLLSLDFSEVSEVQAEDVLGFNADKEKCMIDGQFIDQEHADCNMDTIGKDACMTAQDHLALERDRNLESSSCENYLIDSSLEQILHSKSRSADVMVGSDVEKSDVLPTESAIPESLISQSLVHEIDDECKSIAGENVVEHSGTKEALSSSPCSAVSWELEGAKGNYASDAADLRDSIYSASEHASEVQTGNHLNATNRSVQENVDEKQVDDAGMNGNVDSTCRSDELFPFDFDEASDVDTNIVLKNSIESEAALDSNANEGNCMFGEQIVDLEHANGTMDPIDKDACMTDGVHSALERPGDLLCSEADNLMDSAPDHNLPNESRSPDGKNDVTYAESASNPPVCENTGVIFDALEEKVVDCSVGDIVTFSKSMEEHDEVTAEQRSEGNDSDTTIDRTDATSPSPYVAGNLTELQEQNHAPLMPSYQQMDLTESACQADTTITTLLDDADNEVTKSNAVFTDSEIALLWGETTKDDIHTDAANVTGYVNEIANVDTTVSSDESAVFTDKEIALFWGEATKDDIEPEAAHVTNSVNVHGLRILDGTVTIPESAIEQILQPENSASGEQDQVREAVGDVQNCIDDKQNENSGRVSEKGEDLDTDDKLLMSSVVQKKSTKSILIHGTPKRLPTFIHDMKENTPAPKTQQFADATALKPSLRRRKALDDLGK